MNWSGRSDGDGKPRVVLFGLFGIGNIGNDGSLQAMLDMLRRERPQAELVCVCAGPDRVRKAFRVEARPMRISNRARGLLRTLDRIFLGIPGLVADAAHAFRTMRGADMMIVPGTGILDDLGEESYQMPLRLFMWCLAARLAGVHIAFASVGAGPIRNRLSRFLMLSAAKRAHYRSYRDGFSREYVSVHGIDTRNDPICPDVVFGLTVPEVPKREGSPFTLGLGVMDCRGWYGRGQEADAIYQTYISKVAFFSAWLVRNGFHIRILIGQESDRRAAVDMLRMMRAYTGRNAAECIQVGPCGSLHDLMREISRTDIVVATRYHSIVCALKMGRPSISIEYAPKNTEVMLGTGLGDYCETAEMFATDALIEKFQRLRRDYHYFQARIRTSVALFQEALAEQDARLLSILSERVARRRSHPPIGVSAESMGDPTH